MEQVKRGRGFWVVSFAVLILPFVSWANRSIVGRLNIHLFHARIMGNQGWWLYTGMRTAVVLAVVSMILRFPKHQGVPNKAEGKGGVFEHLMGIRAMACIIVLMGHFFLIYFPFKSSAPAIVQMLLLSCPWAGVWLFFTLSGYLMGKGFVRGRYTLDEAGYRQFMRNRMLRIAPVYYASIFVLSVYRYPEVFQWKQGWILLEMSGFDYRGDLTINPNSILWSVSTEMQFYLLAPLMILFLIYLKEKVGNWFVVVPLCCLCLGTVLKLWIKIHMGSLQMFSYGYAPLIPNLDLFLAGMSVNLLPRPLAKKWAGPALFASSLGFYWLVSCITFYRSYFHWNYEDLMARMPILCCLIACALIYLAEMRGKIKTRNWFLISLQGTGTLTYCLYVFHPEVFAANVLPNVRSLGVSLGRFPLVMIETFLMAAFFYYAAEKPFDRKKLVSHLADAP